jgi:predicted DNA-binding transcriptional regulator YafY
VQNLSALPIVQDAVSRDRTLMIGYRQTGRERVQRTIHPLGLVAKGTTWYLVANTPNGFRTYRVSRIEEATILETRFERPTDFDLAAYWKASTEEFHVRPRYAATLRLEPRCAESMRTWCHVQPAPMNGRPDPDGWVTLCVQFDDEEAACFAILGLGPRVDIIEPASLQARVKADVAATFERVHRCNRRRRGIVGAPVQSSPVE